jgi:hypothetical protein
MVESRRILKTSRLHEQGEEMEENVEYLLVRAYALAAHGR